jgi:hypothetical protein
MSDYIHLNPARAGLLDAQAPDLAAFAWSSFPVYAGRVAGPDWLVTGRVLGSHECAPSRAGQKAYAEYMRGRVAEELGLSPKELARQWRTIRRGWYLGGTEFKERLLGRVAAVTAGKKRESFAGGAVRAHDERAAEQLLQGGLAALGLTLSEARTLRHNDRRKQGLAWLMRASTVVSVDWVIGRLRLGHRSNVSRATRAFNEGQKDAVAKIRRQLQRCKSNDATMHGHLFANPHPDGKSTRKTDPAGIPRCSILCACFAGSNATRFSMAAKSPCSRPS